jgi:hypothetical protein
MACLSQVYSDVTRRGEKNADYDAERIPQPTQKSSNGSATTSDTTPCLMNSTIPQPYKPAEQGTFEASLGGIEDMINPLMELDWVRHIY